MNHGIIHQLFIAYLFASLAFAVQSASADEQPPRFEAADSQGVTATRSDRAVFLTIDATVTGPITLPRLAAPLASMSWQGSETDDGISLKPEQDHWVISWKNRPAQDATLVLLFGAEPILLGELKPTTATTDGSFYLPAHLARTAGEKVRYEPQPFKNTVGYWTGKGDSATWTFKLDKPGRYSVAILQGCGKGQGGSKAILSVMQAQRQVANHEQTFEVVETGHFQNFRWVHVGEIELGIVDNYELTVRPVQIAKAALMDIRAIHLIRLPDEKK